MVVIDVRQIPSQVSGLSVLTGSVGDPKVWQSISERYQIDAVYHCAGLISVAESVRDPSPYFNENVSAGIQMLDHLREIGSIPVIFSSTAAVYGVPHSVPIPETAPTEPVNPYGMTKRQFEQVLEEYHKAYGQPWIALRYFNAAGMVEGVKEQHEPETHLLPLVADAFRASRAPTVYGTRYPTKDGSAVRDYIHVADLADAHLLARDYLHSGNRPRAFNLGSGQGTSVLEVVRAFQEVSGKNIDPVLASNRAGDPPVLVASIAEARSALHWEPMRSDIRQIVEEVWRGRQDLHGA